jgi:hypothetical protein
VARNLAETKTPIPRYGIKRLTDPIPVLTSRSAAAATYGYDAFGFIRVREAAYDSGL